MPIKNFISCYFFFFFSYKCKLFGPYTLLTYEINTNKIKYIYLSSNLYVVGYSRR